MSMFYELNMFHGEHVLCIIEYIQHINRMFLLLTIIMCWCMYFILFGRNLADDTNQHFLVKMI